MQGVDLSPEDKQRLEEVKKRIWASGGEKFSLWEILEYKGGVPIADLEAMPTDKIIGRIERGMNKGYRIKG